MHFPWRSLGMFRLHQHPRPVCWWSSVHRYNLSGSSSGGGLIFLELCDCKVTLHTRVVRQRRGSQPETISRWYVFSLIWFGKSAKTLRIKSHHSWGVHLSAMVRNIILALATARVVMCGRVVNLSLIYAPMSYKNSETIWPSWSMVLYGQILEQVYSFTCTHGDAQGQSLTLPLLQRFLHFS